MNNPIFYTRSDNNLLAGEGGATLTHVIVSNILVNTYGGIMIQDATGAQVDAVSLGNPHSQNDCEIKLHVPKQIFRSNNPTDFMVKLIFAPQKIVEGAEVTTTLSDVVLSYASEMNDDFYYIFTTSAPTSVAFNNPNIYSYNCEVSITANNDTMYNVPEVKEVFMTEVFKAQHNWSGSYSDIYTNATPTEPAFISDSGKGIRKTDITLTLDNSSVSVGYEDVKDIYAGIANDVYVRRLVLGNYNSDFTYSLRYVSPTTTVDGESFTTYETAFGTVAGETCCWLPKELQAPGIYKCAIKAVLSGRVVWYSNVFDLEIGSSLSQQYNALETNNEEIVKLTDLSVVNLKGTYTLNMTGAEFANALENMMKFFDSEGNPSIAETEEV